MSVTCPSPFCAPGRGQVSTFAERVCAVSVRVRHRVRLNFWKPQAESQLLPGPGPLFIILNKRPGETVKAPCAPSICHFSIIGGLCITCCALHIPGPSRTPGHHFLGHQFLKGWTRTIMRFVWPPPWLKNINEIGMRPNCNHYSSQSESDWEELVVTIWLEGFSGWSVAADLSRYETPGLG